MATHRVTREILEAALAGFQMEKQRIEGQLAEVQAMLDGAPAAESEVPQAGTKRAKRSAAVRRRMAEAQKARWAKVKSASEIVFSSPAKTKRKTVEPGPQTVPEKKKRGRPKKAVPSATAKKVSTAKSPRKAQARKATAKRSVAAVVAPSAASVV